MGIKSFFKSLFTSDNLNNSQQSTLNSQNNTLKMSSTSELVKKEIIRINNLIKEFKIQIKRENICNIFNNFLEENNDKVFVWSMTLFLYAGQYDEEAFDEREFNSFNFREKEYVQQLREYFLGTENDKKDKFDRMIECFLTNGNMLDSYCIDGKEDIGSDLIIPFMAIRYDKFHKLKTMSAKKEWDQLDIKNYLVNLCKEIIDYYEEIFRLKDALKESNIVPNFSDDLFYLLMQYFIGLYRLKVIDLTIYEYKDLVGKSLKEDIKTLFNLKIPQFEIEKTIELLYGKIIDIDGCFDSVWAMDSDYGLSFKDIRITYYDLNKKRNVVAPTSREAVALYAKTLKNQEYITRLANNIKTKEKITISTVDSMSGQEFEKFVSKLFQKIGYETIITKVSGDQGVDVIAKNSETTIAIQAKCYSSPVGNHSIMEAVAGMKYYKADKCMVITNQTFTKSAIELAKANNVILWDRKTLKEKIDEVL